MNTEIITREEMERVRSLVRRDSSLWTESGDISSLIRLVGVAAVFFVQLFVESLSAEGDAPSVDVEPGKPDESARNSCKLALSSDNTVERMPALLSAESMLLLSPSLLSLLVVLEEDLFRRRRESAMILLSLLPLDVVAHLLADLNIKGSDATAFDLLLVCSLLAVKCSTWCLLVVVFVFVGSVCRVSAAEIGSSCPLIV